MPISISGTHMQLNKNYSEKCPTMTNQKEQCNEPPKSIIKFSIDKILATLHQSCELNMAEGPAIIFSLVLLK